MFKFARTHVHQVDPIVMITFSKMDHHHSGWLDETRINNMLSWTAVVQFWVGCKMRNSSGNNKMDLR